MQHNVRGHHLTWNRVFFAEMLHPSSSPNALAQTLHSSTVRPGDPQLGRLAAQDRRLQALAVS